MKHLRVPATIVAAAGILLLLASLLYNLNDDLASHELGHRLGLMGLGAVAVAAVVLYKAGER
jgi:predicted Zn-dependent protease